MAYARTFEATGVWHTPAHSRPRAYGIRPYVAMYPSAQWMMHEPWSLARRAHGVPARLLQRVEGVLLLALAFRGRLLHARQHRQFDELAG